MPRKDIFLKGTNIMTWNVMGQEVEEPVYELLCYCIESRVFLSESICL